MSYDWKTIICKENENALNKLGTSIPHFICKALDKEVSNLIEEKKLLTASITTLKESHQNELIQAKEDILDIKIKYLELLNTVKEL